MLEKKRILVVEDDGAVRDLIAAYLGTAGHDILTAQDGFAMQKVLEQEHIDLLLLDLNLPDADGIELARQVRQRSRMGIIIVSERADPDERARGLEIGADDYIPKPFFPRELLARVHNVLERTSGNEDFISDQAEDILLFGQWTMDRHNRILISADGVDPRLTPAEFDMLAYLVTHSNQLLSREALAEALHDGPTEAGVRSVDVLVSRIRKKMNDTKGEGQMIETARGHGYRFATPVKHR